MDRRTRLVLNLLAELQRLTTDGAETAVRLTIRTGTGDFIGDIPLTDMAGEALTDTVRSLANLAEKPAALPYDSPVEFELTDQAAAVDPGVTPGMDRIDPILEAELEEYCIGLDTDFLVQMAAQDPKAAVAAFDEITSDVDGEL